MVYQVTIVFRMPVTNKKKIIVVIAMVRKGKEMEEDAKMSLCTKCKVEFPRERLVKC